MLLSGPYPTRSVDDNLADIAAQIAANQQGARDLLAADGALFDARRRGLLRHIQARRPAEDARRARPAARRARIASSITSTTVRRSP